MKHVGRGRGRKVLKQFFVCREFTNYGAFVLIIGFTVTFYFSFFWKRIKKISGGNEIKKKTEVMFFFGKGREGREGVRGNSRLKISSK